jgi:hypothetical protein
MRQTHCHEGMCWGAVAAPPTRTTAIEPVAKNREQQANDTGRTSDEQHFPSSQEGGFIALVPIPKGVVKGKEGGARAAHPSDLATGPALGSVPQTVALSSAQSNFILRG